MSKFHIDYAEILPGDETLARRGGMPSIRMVTGLYQRVRMDADVMWERRLELHINPRPWWMPTPIWKWLIRLLLVQLEEL